MMSRLHRQILQQRTGIKILQNATAFIHFYNKIGKREVVGYGRSGNAIYYDDRAFPMPPVRFKEPNNEYLCLHAKEQLDWKKLSLQEKKALYRHSFCQTFSEMAAGTGEWKLIVACGLFAVSLGLWITMINHKFLYDELPESFDEEHQKAQLKRMLTLDVGIINGISSKWDYENNKWK